MIALVDIFHLDLGDLPDSVGEVEVETALRDLVVLCVDPDVGDLCLQLRNIMLIEDFLKEEVNHDLEAGLESLQPLRLVTVLITGIALILLVLVILNHLPPSSPTFVSSAIFEEGMGPQT